MIFSFEYFGNRSPMQVREYDFDLDDIIAIFADVLDHIEDNASFCVQGFGIEDWKLSVSYDFSIFLEQLPNSIKAISNDNNFEIGFYAQGTEKIVKFHFLDGVYFADCFNLNGECISLGSEKMGKDEFLDMLIRIRCDFLEILSAIAPSLRVHPWIIEWIEK